jgi:hypothetical protein
MLDIIVSTKSVLFKFLFGGGCSLANFPTPAALWVHAKFLNFGTVKSQKSADPIYTMAEA